MKVNERRGEGNRKAKKVRLHSLQVHQDSGGEQAPAIEHASESADSHLRVRIPVGLNRENEPIPGQSYLLSVLARANSLGLESHYYCRVYSDTDDRFLQDAFTSGECEITGRVEHRAFGLKLRKSGQRIDLPNFDRDELAKVF